MQIFQPKLLPKNEPKNQDRKTNSMVQFLEEVLAGKLGFDFFFTFSLKLHSKYRYVVWFVILIFNVFQVADFYYQKNVPVDWEGKRIPYWLYKLHGLSHFYACEICDGAEYRGPRAFAQHFQQAKHSMGMKLLGIPNTKHFNNITSKQDAKALWCKIQNEKKQKMFTADVQEEYEDSLGNVISKRIYEDLKNNGLL